MKKQKNKICFRCKKFIFPKENYFAFEEFNEDKSVNIDYAHRKCWDDFLKGIGNVDEAMSLLRRVKSQLTKTGVLPPEEIIIT